MIPHSNVMIDIETLGTGPDAAILSIGAVMFGSSGTGIEFYTTVDAQSAVDAGGSLTISTVAWWARQGAKAQEVLSGKHKHIDAALMELSEWMGAHCEVHKAKVWANSPSFDCVILKSAYKAAGMSVPWMFYNERCHRTMKSLYPVPYAKAGTMHNAVDDARNQACQLIKIFSTAGLEL